MMRRIELSDPTLLELMIGQFLPNVNTGEVDIYHPMDGPDYSMLGYNIGANTRLKGLCLDEVFTLH